MSQVKLGDKNIPFIYQGNELLYPNPIKDGLVLWYDFSGKSSTSTQKGITKDLSGNSLTNAMMSGFLYSDSSGYREKGIKFDGVDDRIIPIAKHPDDNTTDVLDMRKVNGGLKFSVEIALTLTSKLLTQGSEIFMTNRTYGRFWIQLTKPANGEPNEFYIATSTYYGTEGAGNILYSSKTEGYQYGDTLYISVTLDKNDKLKLYINGDLKKEVPLNTINIVTPQDPDLKVYLGQSSQDAYYRRFEHELHSLKVYDRVLTSQEVQHNYKLEKERWGI